jgi:hypothetical protein
LSRTGANYASSRVTIAIGLVDVIRRTGQEESRRDHCLRHVPWWLVFSYCMAWIASQLMLKAGVPLGFRNSTFFEFGSNISVSLTPASDQMFYTLVPFSNLFSKRIPFVWQHVMVWGGRRCSPRLALQRLRRIPEAQADFLDMVAG